MHVGVLQCCTAVSACVVSPSRTQQIHPILHPSTLLLLIVSLRALCSMIWSSRRPAWSNNCSCCRRSSSGWQQQQHKAAVQQRMVMMKRQLSQGPAALLPLPRHGAVLAGQAAMAAGAAGPDGSGSSWGDGWRLLVEAQRAAAMCCGRRWCGLVVRLALW